MTQTDPKGRYMKLDVQLGKGSFKVVYKALDLEEGIEVAWNQVKLDRFSEDEKASIVREIRLLQQLDHENILNFYGSWYDEAANVCVFITEIMAGGTLKSFVEKKGSQIKLKVIKKWSRQILSGLKYLHGLNPPIVHRDLKCENIFVNGSSGSVKIGDFGLSSEIHESRAQSVIGTPEFMAPELLDENYDSKVDIYAFGMSMLEMITQEYPYLECANYAQVFKKVLSGQKPRCLYRIGNSEVRSFIALCLCDRAERLSAVELLSHPFFDDMTSNDPVDLLSEEEMESRFAASLNEGEASGQGQVQVEDADPKTLMALAASGAQILEIVRSSSAQQEDGLKEDAVVATAAIEAQQTRQQQEENNNNGGNGGNNDTGNERNALQSENSTGSNTSTQSSNTNNTNSNTNSNTGTTTTTPGGIAAAVSSGGDATATPSGVPHAAILNNTGSSTAATAETQNQNQSQNQSTATATATTKESNGDAGNAGNGSSTAENPVNATLTLEETLIARGSFSNSTDDESNASTNTPSTENHSSPAQLAKIKTEENGFEVKLTSYLESEDKLTLEFGMRQVEEDSQWDKFTFEYMIEEDTPADIARELASEFRLPEVAEDLIETVIFQGTHAALDEIEAEENANDDSSKGSGSDSDSPTQPSSSTKSTQEQVQQQEEQQQQQNTEQQSTTEEQVAAATSSSTSTSSSSSSSATSDHVQASPNPGVSATTPQMESSATQQTPNNNVGNPFDNNGAGTGSTTGAADSTQQQTPQTNNNNNNAYQTPRQTPQQASHQQLMNDGFVLDAGQMHNNNTNATSPTPGSQGQQQPNGGQGGATQVVHTKRPSLPSNESVELSRTLPTFAEHAIDVSLVALEEPQERNDKMYNRTMVLQPRIMSNSRTVNGMRSAFAQQPDVSVEKLVENARDKLNTQYQQGIINSAQLAEGNAAIAEVASEMRKESEQFIEDQKRKMRDRVSAAQMNPSTGPPIGANMHRRPSMPLRTQMSMDGTGSDPRPISDGQRRGSSYTSSFGGANNGSHANHHTGSLGSSSLGNSHTLSGSLDSMLSVDDDDNTFGGSGNAGMGRSNSAKEINSTQQQQNQGQGQGQSGLNVMIDTNHSNNGLLNNQHSMSVEELPPRSPSSASNGHLQQQLNGVVGSQQQQGSQSGRIKRKTKKSNPFLEVNSTGTGTVSSISPNANTDSVGSSMAKQQQQQTQQVQQSQQQQQTQQVIKAKDMQNPFLQQRS